MQGLINQLGHYLDDVETHKRKMTQAEEVALVKLVLEVAREAKKRGWDK